MDDDERLIYESALTEFRQALAEAQWSLAQANGRVKVLQRQIETLAQPAQ